MEDSVPFMKELASSDRKIRDSALSKWRLYLLSGRAFTPSELLKAWSGFFIAMWHQDRPKPQAALADSFADLSLAVPDNLFLPFMRAFWSTMARRWTEIDSLRMEKFLRLVRVMVRAGLEWCKRGGWEKERVQGWNAEMRRLPLSVPGESAEQADGEGERMVGDGMRYHVLDVYVDELERADEEEKQAPVALIMGPVRRLMEKANTKALRERARDCAEDERLSEWDSVGGEHKGDGDEEFTGFDGD